MGAAMTPARLSERLRAERNAEGRVEADQDDECYCDFPAREFFGCFDRTHDPMCPQAARAYRRMEGKNEQPVSW